VVLLALALVEVSLVLLQVAVLVVDLQEQWELLFQVEWLRVQVHLH
jgi:hypothetical protein